MASLVLTVRETLRYRGAIGQWAWVLHRVTGLGVVLFLTLHVIDTSWAVFFPDLYEKAIAIYQTPLFTIGEFALVFCVVYHAFNGLRIGIFDFRPDLWRYQQQAAMLVLVATVLLLVPVFLGMSLHVVDHYSHDPFILPIGEVLVEQIPFAVGMVVAAIGALILSWVWGLLFGVDDTPVNPKDRGSKLERFWWSFMRVSGLLIVPLVFGHLAAMHVVQGVFDLTAQGSPIVGVSQVGEPLSADGLAEILAADSTAFLNGWNDSGTATEFVAERWSFLVAGVAMWRLIDIALLALVTVHGFNGLRYVLTDYTTGSPLLRRAVTFLCIIGGVTLLVVGGAALIGTIEPESIRMAQESLAAIRGGLH